MAGESQPLARVFTALDMFIGGRRLHSWGLGSLLAELSEVVGLDIVIRFRDIFQSL